jgi:hypothetical protein
MLSDSIQELGYNLNIDTVRSTLLNDVEVGRDTVDLLWNLVASSQATFVLQLLGVIVTELNRRNQTDLAVSLLNVVNAQALPAGYEVLLGKVDASSGVGTVLTSLKSAAWCASSGATPPCQPAVTIGSGTPAAVPTPMDLALSGMSGVSPNVTGYTSTPVYAGYQNLSTLGMGLVYQVNLTTLRAERQSQTVVVLNELNKMFLGTTEILIETLANPGVPLTKMKMSSECLDGICGKDIAGGEAVLGVLTGNPTAIDIDYRRTVPIIATAFPFTSMDGCLLYEIDVSEVEGKILNSMNAAAATINAKLNGQQELLMAHQIKLSNGNTSFEVLGNTSGSGSCIGDCASTAIANQSLTLAAVECQSGVFEANDANGVLKAAAYACVPSLASGMLKLHCETL